MRIPIAERIEASSEQDVLADATFDGSCQLVLRNAAANRQDGAKERGADREFVPFAEKTFRGLSVFVGADDPQRERIVEDFRLPQRRGGPKVRTTSARSP